MGLQTDAAWVRAAAMTVMGGRAQTAASRDSLAESLIGERKPVAKLLSETRESPGEDTSKLDGRWAFSRCSAPTATGPSSRTPMRRASSSL